mmetsp:Transcript_39139/g.60583  ORF Transcript_39139/g.60583 Transcript_39139/m.60583 type:complete len:80 (+) Transcript_39139:318-557(+)
MPVKQSRKIFRASSRAGYSNLLLQIHFECVCVLLYGSRFAVGKPAKKKSSSRKKISNNDRRWVVFFLHDNIIIIVHYYE